MEYTKIKIEGNPGATIVITVENKAGTTWDRYRYKLQLKAGIVHSDVYSDLRDCLADAYIHVSNALWPNR